jgi:hypothetical protein
MATTSIWSVKGWLGKVVIYVENPDKTMNSEIAKLPELPSMEEKETQGLSDVIAYAVNAEKTRQQGKTGTPEEGGIDDEGEKVMEQYVSGVNCTPTTARSEMMAVKKRYGKDEGIMAFHGYQSFAPGECTPAMAHEIGVKLAEELWGSRFQVIVATHLDKAHHLHNHFVVNSVSFADGLRYHRSNQDYRDMRDASDRLCREYGLSVIENPKGKAKHYGQWRAEQEGKPTYLGMIKADVDEAIVKARTEKQFFHYLKEKGYSIKFGKDITVRAEGRDRGMKLARNLGEGYTIESIRRRILTQKAEKPAPIAPQEKKTYVIKVHGNLQKTRKIGGLRGLYLRYCYLLGILPKNRPPVSPKQVHILFREDLIKLDKISKETRLLCHYRIDTTEQLFSLKEDLQGKMAELADKRKHLRYKSRSVKDGERLSGIKEEIAGLSKQIGELRKEVVLCDGIAARSGVMKEKLEAVRQENSVDKKNIHTEKEENSHEHIRRSR